MLNAMNRPKNLIIPTDAKPKQRREKTVAELTPEKTVAELTPGSRQAWGRGCRCSTVTEHMSEIIIVRSATCPHHRGIGFWHKKERRGWA